jgi:hypothetical protein
MRKGKSRARVARRDILQRISQAQVRDLQKRNYSKQAYDATKGPGGQDRFQ